MAAPSRMKQMAKMQKGGKMVPMKKGAKMPPMKKGAKMSLAQRMEKDDTPV